MKQITHLCLLAALSVFISPVTGQETINDREGNSYKIIEIGDQVWMAENLKSTRFSNGDIIPLIKEPEQWKNLTTAGCCDMNNDPDYTKKSGKLYNWYTAADERNVCPSGWHVPSDKEWTRLTTFLSGEKGPGCLLPEMITLNRGLFGLLPEGFRGFEGEFNGLGYGGGGWWSVISCTENTASYRGINFNTAGKVPMEGRKTYGYNIRCIKD